MNSSWNKAGSENQTSKPDVMKTVKLTTSLKPIRKNIKVSDYVLSIIVNQAKKKKKSWFIRSPIIFHRLLIMSKIL